MKKLLLFILIFLLAIKNFVSIAQPMNYLYNSLNDDLIYNGLEYNNSYYFLMNSGTFSEDFNPIEYEILGYDNYLLKFDKSFNVIDSIGFDSISNYNFVYWDSRIKNDTLILLGKALTPDVSDGQVVITKYQLPTLELIDTRIYGKPDVYELPSDFLLKENGNIIIISKNIDEIYSGTIVIMEISNTGELIFYNNDTTLNLPWANITQMPVSSEFFLNSDLETVVFDSSFQNYQRFYNPNAGVFQYLGKKSNYNDSSYLIAGRKFTQPPLSPSFDISYYLMNYDYNFVDSGFIYLPDTFDIAGTINVINSTDILYGGTHNVNWTGVTPGPFEEEYRWLVLRNENILTKEENWNFSYGGDASYLMRDVFITKDGSFIVYCTRYDWKNTDIWQRDVLIFEVDSNGIIVSSNTTVELPFATVYPNPGKNNLSIRCGFNNGNIKIIDQSGKTVLEKTINSFEYIDVSGLMPGLYIIMFYEEGKFMFSQKWIKS